MRYACRRLLAQPAPTSTLPLCNPVPSSVKALLALLNQGIHSSSVPRQRRTTRYLDALSTTSSLILSFFSFFSCLEEIKVTGGWQNFQKPYLATLFIYPLCSDENPESVFVAGCHAWPFWYEVFMQLELKRIHMLRRFLGVEGGNLEKVAKKVPCGCIHNRWTRIAFVVVTTEGARETRK